MAGLVPRNPVDASDRLADREAAAERRLEVVALPERSVAVAHGLPAQLTSLIGRDQDLEAVRATLSSARLVTLTGAGGVGKTRLAIEAAARGVGDFPDGVWWIELAALADGGMVASSLVEALGVRPLPGSGELDAAVGFLTECHGLLAIDNCEHVVEAVAGTVEVLLRACPSLSVLATSRVPLGIPGETRWTVPPLSDSDTAHLFIDRARRVDGFHRAHRADVRAIAGICRQLEGIPLALELAAARVAVLSPEAIARGLGDALGLLTASSRTVPARQRTLRASLDWSHGLLPAEARVLLRRLGVFAGGTTLELAREVCAGNGLGREHVLPNLETLVEHSLVRADADGATMRYRLLETVGQYALERLEDAGEQELIRDRHRDALLELAERQRREALTPRQPEVFAALDREAANLAAALDRALETDPDKALRICLALDFWYRARARFREADDAYARAISASDPSPVLQARALAAWAWIVGNWGDFARANELAADAAARAEETANEEAIAGTLLVVANHRFFTDPIGAVELLRRCRDLGRAAGDGYISTRSEALLRGVAWFQQDAHACCAGFDELLPRLEELGDRETLAWFWFEQGAVRYPLGEHAAAVECLRQAIAAAAEIGEPTADRAARSYLALVDLAAGDAERALEALLSVEAHTLRHGGSFALPWIEVLVAQAEAGSGRLEAARDRLTTVVEIEAWGAAHALAWAHAELGEMLQLLGEREAAGRQGTRALEAARQLANGWLAAKAQRTLGRLAARRGEWGEAQRLHHEALATIWDQRYRIELPAALEALADVGLGFGRHTDAARMLGAAQRARHELGFVAWPGHRAELEELRGRLAGALGEPMFERMRSEGAALDPEEAVAWLRRTRGARRRPARGWESLTPTEVEVIRHTAAGLTNPQIAERLFIARATVKVHLSHVYAKLGVRTRSELAAKTARRLPPTEP